MKVIVAGFSKTGTKSMTAALTLLGYNVYDFLEQFYYHYDEWDQIMTKGGDVELFRKMFKDVDAVSDAPGYAFWEEIQEAYPDSKIVFMIRDEDSWFQSILGQFDEYNAWNIVKIARILTPTGRKLFYHFRRTFGVCLGVVSTHPWLPTILGETVLKQRYRQHNSYLLQNAPKNKLLVFNMREGWKPLCEFLNVEVPDIPFPRKNVGGKALQEAAQSNPIVKKMASEVRVVGFTLSVMILLFVCVLIRILLY